MDLKFTVILCISMMLSPSITATFHRLTPSIQGQVAGIILSFHDGSSYDNLFQNVKQQSKEGSVVLTYIAGSELEKTIYEALNGKFQNSNALLRQFVGQVQKLTVICPSCIVFNWECSSGYSHQNFSQNGKHVYKLLEMIIKRGYMAMFSDFSLKALIKQWNSNVLGPNPFVKIGQTSAPINMKFDKNTLLKCPSSQLQAVALLSKSDELKVKVLGGTIMYAVNQRRQRTSQYQLQVLTLASNFPAPEPHLESQINGNKGLPAHVLLSYKDGGKIITSMGHWIQLFQIDTSIQRVYGAAKQMFGSSQAQLTIQQYNSIQGAEGKRQYLKKKSIKYVQNQHPGKNKMSNNKLQTIDL